MDKIITSIKKFIILCALLIVVIVIFMYITEKPNDAADLIKSIAGTIGDFINGLLTIGRAIAE